MIGTAKHERQVCGKAKRFGGSDLALLQQRLVQYCIYDVFIDMIGLKQLYARKVFP